MYGHPADKKYAEDCFKLWGLSLNYGGPRGYQHEVSYELHINGQDVSESSKIRLIEIVGRTVNQYLTDEERRIVRVHYVPAPDSRYNGEFRRCVVSFTIRQLKKAGIKRVYHQKINRVLDGAVSKLARVLSYPSMLAEDDSLTEAEKKVCNF